MRCQRQLGVTRPHPTSAVDQRVQIHFQSHSVCVENGQVAGSGGGWYKALVDAKR